ncbi:hypothetical protein NUW54_g4303 [Trametes sanguinea]|uniref:Uncharacterized protein n=1 Tax=Trametes sanguinea TaxID=158606 RepID=A0ACC1PYB7_9APHY|nr:hypothetical protein NUW54_g4303 [Trametes sanguinea]
MEVFVGAAVKLTRMTRLNPPSICPIRVDAFEVVFDIEDNDGDSPPLIARSISNTSSISMDIDGAEAGWAINGLLRFTALLALQCANDDATAGSSPAYHGCRPSSIKSASVLWGGRTRWLCSDGGLIC